MNMKVGKKSNKLGSGNEISKNFEGELKTAEPKTDDSIADFIVLIVALLLFLVVTIIDSIIDGIGRFFSLLDSDQ